MNQLYSMLADIRHPAYEGEGDDDSGAAGGSTATADTGGDAGGAGGYESGDSSDGANKTSFTQDELNRILADDRRKHQEQVKKALKEVEALRSKAKLTAEERSALDKRVQTLQDELLTKEELAKKEKERLQKEAHQKIKTLESERDSWRDRYTNSSIRRAITDASVKNNAFNPSQIVALLQGDTRLVEELDDQGSPTGRFRPKVRFEDVGDDGSTITLDLSPEDAVKRMRELPDYLNLFKGEGKGGLGSNNQPSGKKIDLKELAKDPETYRRLRAEGKIKF